MTTEIELTKRLQRERRPLCERIEDLEGDLKEAQDRVRTAAEALTNPESAGNLDELGTAPEVVKTVGSALAEAQAELRAFDEQHGTEDLKVREARLLAEQKVARRAEIEAEIKQITKERIDLLVSLRTREERAGAALRRVAHRCAISR